MLIALGPTRPAQRFYGTNKETQGLDCANLTLPDPWHLFNEVLVLHKCSDQSRTRSADTLDHSRRRSHGAVATNNGTRSIPDQTFISHAAHFTVIELSAVGTGRLVRLGSAILLNRLTTLNRGFAEWHEAISLANVEITLSLSRGLKDTWVGFDLEPHQRLAQAGEIGVMERLSRIASSSLMFSWMRVSRQESISR